MSFSPPKACSLQNSLYVCEPAHAICQGEAHDYRWIETPKDAAWVFALRYARSTTAAEERSGRCAPIIGRERALLDDGEWSVRSYLNGGCAKTRVLLRLRASNRHSTPFQVRGKLL
jgi:hypothetical protein